MALAGALFFAPIHSEGAERKILRNHVPAAAAQQTPLGDLPATASMELSITVALPHRAELTNFIAQLYDPARPLFHRYVTPSEFAERFGPSPADYEKVARFAEAHGLTVTRRHPNRLLLNVSGTVSNVESAFHVKMRRYRHPTEARNFYAPDREPSIDADVPAVEINGLNNFISPHPMNLRARPLGAGAASQPGATGSGPANGYIGKDFRNAYIPNVTLDGTGQRVALLEFDGYYHSDITNYEHLAGLGQVPVTNVLIDNFSGIPSTNANFVGEVSLDIETALAMAPNLSSVIVYEASATNLSFLEIDDLLSQMAFDNQARQISCSWAWGGPTNAGVDSIFLEFQSQGQSFFQASGDSGAYNGNIEEPSDDAYVTVVGGTTLTTATAGGPWSAEQVWSYFPIHADCSSGGVSTIFPIPTWQKSVSMSLNQGSTTMRNIPDVALTADNVFVFYNNGVGAIFAGTSCAAPLWAGFTALINQHAAAHGQGPVGFINPAVYGIGLGSSYTTDFHDITVGNNTNFLVANAFFAETGYDLCTGWGTPNGSNMVNALGSQLAAITPNLNFPGASSVVYGTAMGQGLLQATTNTPGILTYSPAAGTVLGAGSHAVSAVFKPNDTYDFNAVTNTANLTVTAAPLTVTASNATRVYGQANPAFNVGYSGFVNGDSVSVLSGSPSLGTTATATSPPGNYAIIASAGTLSAANYSFNFVNGQLTVTMASSAMALGASTNLAVAGANVTFTATLTAVAPGAGTPTGSVQFYADSVALGSLAALVSGVAALNTTALAAGTHVITAQYAGDGNFSGTSGTLGANEVVVSPPNDTTIVLARTALSGAKMRVSALVATQTNANTGALSLISTSANSTNGGAVTVNNNWILYAPQPGFTNDDEFSYVVADGQGLQFTETVLVTVPTDLNQSSNIVSVQALANNGSQVQFQGIPGRAYTIQYSQSLDSPAWETIGTATADVTGSFSSSYTPPNGSPAGFYRSTYP